MYHWEGEIFSVNFFPPFGIIIPDNLPITLQESFQKEKNTTLCSCDHKSNWAENKSVKKRRKKGKGRRKKGKNNERLWKDELILNLVKKYDEQKNKETCNQLPLEIWTDLPPLNSRGSLCSRYWFNITDDDTQVHFTVMYRGLSWFLMLPFHIPPEQGPGSGWGRAQLWSWLGKGLFPLIWGSTNEGHVCNSSWQETLALPYTLSIKWWFNQHKSEWSNNVIIKRK